MGTDGCGFGLLYILFSLVLIVVGLLAYWFRVVILGCALDS